MTRVKTGKPGHQEAGIPAPSSGISSWAWGSLLIPLSLLAYIPAWNGDFIWDDDELITENPAVHLWSGLPQLWTGAHQWGGFPLTSTLFWMEWQLWGNHAAGYHLLNILLHGLGAVLLWRVGKALKITLPWMVAPLGITTRRLSPSCTASASVSGKGA